jgi:hypothetical protein
LCEALKQSAGRSAVGSNGVRGLLVNQVALALVLLIGAGLLIGRLPACAASISFRPENLLTVNTRALSSTAIGKEAGFPPPTGAGAWVLPSVVSAGFINGVPAFKGWVNSYRPRRGRSFS